MEGHRAVRLDVLEIHRQRLAGDQVHRNGVAGEGVDRQQIEFLRRLALQHQARVAERGFDLRLALAQIVEVAGGDVDHLRVDLVEAEIVAALAIGSQGAGAESDDADPLVHRVDALQRHPHPRGIAVVAGDDVAMIGPDVLLAVHDHAVHQAPLRVGVAVRQGLLDPERAVEIAAGQDRVFFHELIEGPGVVATGADGGERRQRRERGQRRCEQLARDHQRQQRAGGQAER